MANVFENWTFDAAAPPWDCAAQFVNWPNFSGFASRHLPDRCTKTSRDDETLAEHGLRVHWDGVGHSGRPNKSHLYTQRRDRRVSELPWLHPRRTSVVWQSWRIPAAKRAELGCSLLACRSLTESAVRRQLRDYVGSYPLSPTFAIKVTEQSGALYFEATQHPGGWMKPVGHDRFVVAGFPAEVSFLRDDGGNVEFLRWHRNRHTYVGLRSESQFGHSVQRNAAN